LENHNDQRNKKWTKNGQPWFLKKVIEFETKSDALKAEKFIKKQKSRVLIEKIIIEGWGS